MEFTLFCCNYLNKYLENKPPRMYESTDAMVELVKLNHVVFCGLKPTDVNKGGYTEGLGLLILPDNFKETLTDLQKESIKTLQNTNKSIFGNREKIPLKIHETFFKEEPINNIEFNEFLTQKNQRER